MMRAWIIALPALLLAACSSEVEPETAETVDEDTVEDQPVDEEPVPEVGSAYTELTDCEIVAQNRSEGGFVQQRCEGHAGYELLVTSADLRDEMAIVTPDGEERDLLFQQVIAEGHFSELGRTVEWRGPTPDDPRVLIVRMEVAEAEDPMAPETSYLAVVQLADPTCIVARVPPGPGQNVAARRFADREVLPECLGKELEEEMEDDA